MPGGYADPPLLTHPVSSLMPPLIRTIREGSGTGRIEALSDGIFAIALTILVLELEAPVLPQGSGGAAVLHAFGETLHVLEFYLISFFVIGFYWYLHHQIFRFIERHDPTLIALNLAALLPITVLSFLTELVGDYSREAEIVALYFGTLSVTGLLFTTLWGYAAHRRRLVSPELPAAVVRAMAFRTLLPTVIFLLGAGISFLHVEIARRVYVLFFLSWLGIAIVNELFQRRYLRDDGIGGASSAGSPSP